MNTSSPQLKKLIIILVIVAVVGAGAYYFFLKGPDIPVSILVPGDDNQVVGQDILVLVDKLKKVSIDPSVFQSALFSSLQDLVVPLVPEQTGRLNPFAAIGSDNFTPSPAPTPAPLVNKTSTSKASPNFPTQ